MPHSPRHATPLTGRPPYELFVMQPRQDRRGDHSVTSGNSVPALDLRACRRARRECRDRDWCVVGSDYSERPTPAGRNEMLVIQPEPPIAAVWPGRADQPLAGRIRLRASTAVFSTVRPIAVTAHRRRTGSNDMVHSTRSETVGTLCARLPRDSFKILLLAWNHGLCLAVIGRGRADVRGFVDDEVRDRAVCNVVNRLGRQVGRSTNTNVGRRRDRVPSVFPDKITRWFPE